jgi:hypothetical protein
MRRVLLVCWRRDEAETEALGDLVGADESAALGPTSLACFTYRLARTLTCATARSQTRTSSKSMNSIWISDRKQRPTVLSIVC